MTNQINRNKIVPFILLAYGLSWLVAAIINIGGMTLQNPIATLMIAMFYMTSPALAAYTVQRLIYKESMCDCGVSLDRSGARWLLHTPVFYILIYLLAFAMIGLFGNMLHITEFGQLDFTTNGLITRFSEFAKDIPEDINSQYQEIFAKISPSGILIVFFIAGIIAGCTLNGLFAFGEELGWRGLLLKETRSLGFIKCSLFIGLVWGVWHAPLILMGLNYPENPYWGILMMCLFTISLTPILIYVRIKSRSIIAPSFLHGMINTMGVIFVLYVNGYNELFSAIAGVAGILSGVLITIGIFVFDRSFIDDFNNPPLNVKSDEVELK